MVKPRIRRPMCSATNRFNSDSNLSQDERQLLPQLLKLLRSGALTSLLTAADIPTPAAPAQPAQTGQKPAKSKVVQERPEHCTRGGGWTPVKIPKVPGTILKDKLLPNGWSVPIIASVSEMSSTGPGICLVSTTDGKKLVNELKSDCPLAILVPTNISGTGEEVHVLI